jgi:endonuclease III related protein
VAIRAGTPLLAWFEALHRAWGPQGWWPGRSRFEIVVGAILTQNVSWTNVEKAIEALRRARLLEPRRLFEAPHADVARHIRSSGYYNQKATRLRRFAELLVAGYGGRLDRLLREPTGGLRRRLLGLPGIGRETADSILLYAAGRPVFVIDAYTRRILARHGAAAGDEDYESLRAGIEAVLPPDARLFNEFHALIVRAGKEHCGRREPRCSGCPLQSFLPPEGPVDFPQSPAGGQSRTARPQPDRHPARRRDPKRRTPPDR